MILVVDVIASRVLGVVNARDVRIVWRDGWLYVARSPTDIASFACEQPKRHGGSFRVLIGEGTLTFYPPGCGACKRRVMASPVGQMSADEIVAAAGVGADV